jgi:hypothetical protein
MTHSEILKSSYRDGWPERVCYCVLLIWKIIETHVWPALKYRKGMHSE